MSDIVRNMTAPLQTCRLCGFETRLQGTMDRHLQTTHAPEIGHGDGCECSKCRCPAPDPLRAATARDAERIGVLRGALALLIERVELHQKFGGCRGSNWLDEGMKEARASLRRGEESR